MRFGEVGERECFQVYFVGLCVKMINSSIYRSPKGVLRNKNFASIRKKGVLR